MLSQQVEGFQATNQQLDEEVSKLRGELRAERTRSDVVENSNKTVS